MTIIDLFFDINFVRTGNPKPVRHQLAIPPFNVQKCYGASQLKLLIYNVIRSFRLLHLDFDLLPVGAVAVTEAGSLAWLS
jgi:hypothetical protein